jgi:lysophospholipase L1-like esterase
MLSWRTVSVAVVMTVAVLTMPGRAVGSVIVSMGDSYASGEAVPPYERGTNDARLGHKCHRSAKAWPRLIGVAAADHLACSGAFTTNIDQVGQTNRGPDSRDQLDRLRDITQTTHIDWILLTVGGNDVHFADKLKHCYLVGNVAGCLANERANRHELNALTPRLTQVYREIMAAAPSSKLLVVGYPDIFPPPTHSDRCAWLTKGMKVNIARYEQLLDQTAAAASRAAQVSYISTRHVLAEHWLCTGKSWIRSIGGKPGDVLGDQQQGHPLKEGQSAIAGRVREWLAEHSHGGGGLLTASGQVGALHIGVSTRSDIASVAGPSDVEGTSPDPDLHALGYDCLFRDNTAGLINGHSYCHIAFYLSRRTGKLVEFVTDSRQYSVLGKVHVGMSTAQAARLAHAQAEGGCTDGIRLTHGHFGFPGGILLTMIIEGGHDGRARTYPNGRSVIPVLGGHVSQFVVNGGGGVFDCS